MSGTQRSGWAVGCFFTFFWSALTLGFDGAIAYFAYENLRSFYFTETVGTVTVSRIEESRDSDGDLSHKPHVEYDYVVGGTTLQGTVRRNGEMGVSGWGARRSVQAIIERYPVGKQVPVFYDPQQPATAVLEQGVNGTELFLAMFLTPFNMIMLALWTGVISPGLPLGTDPAIESLIEETGHGWALRTPRVHPLTAFFGGLGVGAFLMIFIVGFTSGFSPSLSGMTTVWMLLLALGVACSTATLRRMSFLVDPGTQQLTITGRWFRPDETIDAAVISGVQPAASAFQTEGAPTTYGVAVRYVDAAGSDRAETLGAGWSKSLAEQIAERMRNDLRLTTTPPPEANHA